MKRLTASIYLFLSNNIVVNNLLIALKLDHKMQLAARQWKAFSYNSKKTEQENAGFSHTSEVQKAIDQLKNTFKNFVAKHIKPNTEILDFGCGPGIYLKMLEENYSLNGIDVSPEMIRKAKDAIPQGTFYCGNFLTTQFNKKYSIIFSISVLEYVPVSQLETFFKKCADLLEPGGFLFIQYPHALRYKDLFYPDRNYINYSPKKIEEKAGKYFRLLSHSQFFDGKKVGLYDKNPYATSSKDFRNGYLLIAQKNV